MEFNKALTISVYVANLGKYNEGVLQGAWLTLPQPEEKIQEILKDKVGIEGAYEEYAIHDHEYEKGLEELGYVPNEYTNLHELNLLAAALQKEPLFSEDLEKIRSWMNEVVGMTSALSDTPVEIANIVLQHDEIPYYSYEYDDPSMSKEEKLGRTLANNLCTSDGKTISKVLKESNLEDYFDYEKYGLDVAYDCYLCDDGYIDKSQDGPASDFYDLKELEDELEGVFEELASEASVDGPASVKDIAKEAMESSQRLAADKPVMNEQSKSQERGI